MPLSAYARGTLLASFLFTLALHPVHAEDVSPAAPAAAPAAAPTEPEPPNATAELDALEAELDAVMDELIGARTRAGILTRSLFHTQLEVEVVRRADALVLERLIVRLDGVPVHDSDGSALAREHAQLFEGHVTPGMHELAIEVTERDREHTAFGYTRNENYRIDVKQDRRTRVELILRDDSDMAAEAAAGDDGEYQVETELRVVYGRASN